jgi:hypothetical protein
LQLLWEGEEIENVYSTNIVIWNAGRQFLDERLISSTDPLRVAYPSDIEVLYAKFVETSRDGLELSVFDRSEQGENALVIDIVGDDALEHGEGGRLKVLSTGPPGERFLVMGRIKGSRKGPVEHGWHAVNTRASWGVALFYTVFMVLTMGGALWNTVTKFREAEGHRISRWLEAVYGLVMGIALVFAMWKLVVHPATAALLNAAPADLFVGQ